MTHLFREYGPWVALLISQALVEGAALVLLIVWIKKREIFPIALTAVSLLIGVLNICSSVRHPPNTSIVHMECEKCHPDDGRVQIRVGPKTGGDQPQALHPKLT